MELTQLRLRNERRLCTYRLGDQGILVRFLAGASDFLRYSLSSSYRVFQWGSFRCGKSGTTCRGDHLSTAGSNARGCTSGVSIYCKLIGV